jgi:hypothetical protein
MALIWDIFQWLFVMLVASATAMLQLVQSPASNSRVTLCSLTSRQSVLSFGA